VKRADEATRRLRALASTWRDVAAFSDAQLAEQIREDGIDILIDLAGHTSDSRLLAFARRPAPVQVTYLGYPDTTGMTGMDWRISDDTCDPPGESDARHTEKLARPADCFLCYRAPAMLPEVTPPPAREAGLVTFGSFNTAAKLNGELARIWARILQNVPGSRLLIKSRGLGDAGTAAHVRSLLASHGIDAERVELVEQHPDVVSHLQSYARMDIALDTFPYNGTTTTCEALIMGVPVVTARGDRHAGRVGATLLRTVGREEWVAKTEDEYVEIATRLASDIPALAAERQEQRARVSASALCDEIGFTRRLEAAYRRMWKGFCDGA
jgi:predicted O-linked N-acetylglucosamine transferase (SPINDLY family)